VHQLGGFRVQGKTDAAAATLLADAKALEQAGAVCVVLELVPATLGQAVSEALATCATIGIGAGPQCHGQVLVLHDMLGLTAGPRPRFVRDFLAGGGSVAEAARAYVAAVKARTFPGTGEGY
jgi:3-methyl-2-oxobutanoate hydroxymethyltransferase